MYKRLINDASLVEARLQSLKQGEKSPLASRTDRTTKLIARYIYHMRYHPHMVDIPPYHPSALGGSISCLWAEVSAAEQYN